MRRIALYTSAMLLLGACGQVSSENSGTPQTSAAQEVPAQPQSAKAEAEAGNAPAPAADIPAGARALIDAYPQFISGYKDNKLLFRDGTSMTYDDGRKKDFATMLDDSDPEDMFSIAYEEPATQPEYLADAGRSRNEALFKKMYGSSAAQVRSRMENVKWFGQTVQFASANGAAKALREVAAELAQYPELKKYLKSSGTFNWRPVRGARRMSAHSYGIAFDIGVDYSDYWLWKNPGASETAKLKYANRIPRRIVEIFRKHGFIWGGSWYHYDTMHFEYRPELLRYAELKGK